MAVMSKDEGGRGRTREDGGEGAGVLLRVLLRVLASAGALKKAGDYLPCTYLLLLLLLLLLRLLEGVVVWIGREP
jgi:hypothetical protein